MAALQIRSVPKEVHEWLVQEAANQHRSINQQALVVLKEYKRFKELGNLPSAESSASVIRPIRRDEVSQKQRDAKIAERRALYDEIKALNKRTGFVYPANLPSPAEMIRRDRDR